MRFILDIRFLYYILFFVPFFLFVLDPVKNYVIPRTYIWLVGAYLFFSTISLATSRQYGVSIELYLRDLSLILISFYAHKHADELKEMIPRSIILLSLLFIGVSFALLSSEYGREFISGVRLNLLYNPAYPHKAIGDFLTFAIVVCAYGILVLKEKKWIAPLVVIFPIFIVSFSRTAYIALGITLIYMLYVMRNKLATRSPVFILSIGLNIIFGMIFFILLVTRIHHPLFTSLQNSLEPTLSMFARPLAFSRFPFWQMGISAFFDAPFTGFGQGSFPFISYRYMTELFLPTLTSFNLVIDTLAEQGIGATISLILLCIYVVLDSKKDNLFYFLTLALIIGFMGFSSFSYTQIWMLFFILLGVTVRRSMHTVIIPKSLLLIIATIGIVYIQLIAIHTILIHADKRKLAQVIYPFNRENTRVLIAMSGLYEQNASQTHHYLKQYRSANATDAFVLEEIGDRYVLMGDTYALAAVTAYKESFTWGMYAYGNDLYERMEKFYTVSVRVNGVAKTKQYIQAFLHNYSKVIQKDTKEIHQITHKKIQSLITEGKEEEM